MFDYVDQLAPPVRFAEAPVSPHCGTPGISSRRRQFDHVDLKRRFRQAAEQRGIDPTTGSTGYQAALVQAELAIAKKFADGAYGWCTPQRWQEMQRDESPDPVQRAADRLEQLVEEWGQEVLLECLLEIRRELRQETPLREIHRRQLTLGTTPALDVAAAGTAAGA